MIRTPNRLALLVNFLCDAVQVDTLDLHFWEMQVSDCNIATSSLNNFSMVIDNGDGQVCRDTST